jgi:hypothetical protein
VFARRVLQVWLMLLPLEPPQRLLPDVLDHDTVAEFGIALLMSGL